MIVIIDDGSTDNTYVIGESLTFESTKVKVRQENQGVSVARNVVCAGRVLCLSMRMT